MPAVGDVVTIEGFMEYAYGEFVIRPFEDQFIVLTGATGVDHNLPTILTAGGFHSVAPNPFNPAPRSSSSSTATTSCS